MKTTPLAAAYDTADFRQWGHALIDLMADHIEQVQHGDIPQAIPYRHPEAELAFWQADFDQGTGDPLAFFRQVLDHSVQLHHPQYMGHQVSVPALISSLAGMVSDLLSNGTGVYEMGMASNAIERVVTDFTCQRIGYPATSNGLITSGGTLANLTAMLAARQAKAPTAVWENGHRERLAILVSEEAHYCIDRAARIMGMGSDGIIKIPTDDQYRLRTDLLPTYYAAARARGLHPIAVVGCAGSTSTGSYDDLEAIADFCAAYDLWFHADGAHGGAVIFNDAYKHLVRGIERADTVVIDYHKMLMTPALNTALLFREAHEAYCTFAQRAQYLWEASQQQEWFQSGKRTFECTKLMLSIKVYAILRTYGVGVFAENIDRLYTQARIFADLIAAAPDFELAVVPASNIVNFRYLPDAATDIDAINGYIRQQLVEAGAFYIVQTTLGKSRYLRTTIMNPLTGVAEFESLLAHCRMWAQRYGLVEMG